MKQLQHLVTQLENAVPKTNKYNSDVSTKPVGWHIEHSLLVINKIIETVMKSNPADFESKFQLKRALIFALQIIPRGRAKAPSSVVPVSEISSLSIQENLIITRKNLEKFAELTGNYFFEHPMFQKLNVKQTEKFLCIHTKHHLKIIQDILQ
ncbi:MAG: hypothetical protein RLZZ231_27 [Bacteroidota bacterium]|jgi:Protein of unknown function (DUF1569)